MTWNAFHHRGEILRTVIETADERRDGQLPMDVPGVTATFRDELDLIAALTLKWHARLSGHIEREMMSQPMDLEMAVMRAWRAATDDLPGIRMIIDHYSEFPTDAAMADVLVKVHEKEWMRLAAAAGLSNDESPAAADAGHRLETRARLSEVAEVEAEKVVEQTSFVDRIKAVLAA
ncbi:MAG: hypothetical protein JWR35_3401 [Marmoricola sp.]|jgi:hypothetical protein|nr:hypothetical protein [Marmoricola sp.]